MSLDIQCNMVQLCIYFVGLNCNNLALGDTNTVDCVLLEPLTSSEFVAAFGSFVPTKISDGSVAP